MKTWLRSHLLRLSILAVIASLLPSPALAITVPAQGDAIEDFIPAGWELEEQISGDLNGDRDEDLALRLIQSGDRGARARSLVVLLSTPKGWKRLAVADNLLLCESCGGMLTSARIKIVKQVLITDQLAGSRGAIQMVHRFWIDQKSGKLVCIGEDLSPYDRANGNAIDDSRNFLTGKRIVNHFRGKGSGRSGGRELVKTETLKVTKKLRPIEAIDISAARDSAIELPSD